MHTLYMLLRMFEDMFLSPIIVMFQVKFSCFLFSSLMCGLQQHLTGLFDLPQARIECMHFIFCPNSSTLWGKCIKCLLKKTLPWLNQTLCKKFSIKCQKEEERRFNFFSISSCIEFTSSDFRCCLLVFLRLSVKITAFKCASKTNGKTSYLFFLNYFIYTYSNINNNNMLHGAAYTSRSAADIPLSIFSFSWGKSTQKWSCIQ